MTDPKDLIGVKGKSSGRTVSEVEFVLLTDLCWTISRPHIDHEYMKNSKFGERILGGPVVLALAEGLANHTSSYPRNPGSGWAFVAMLGYENVKLTAPLKINDTITVESEITEWRATSHPDKSILVTKRAACNQDNRQILEYTVLNLYEKTK